MHLKIAIAFHNGSNYDYDFIKWRPRFIVLAENTEKYITFKVPIEKEVTRIDRNKEEIPKNIAVFMASSL